MRYKRKTTSQPSQNMLGQREAAMADMKEMHDEDEELIVRKMERNEFFKQQTSFKRTDSLKRKIKRIPNSGA